MKKQWFTIALLILCFIPLLMIAFSPSAKAATTLPSDVNVNHTIEIRNGGLLTINDTVKLITKPGESVQLQNYSLGFPYNYKLNLDYAFAYQTSNPSSSLNLQLDTGLGRIGFYGVTITFPQTVNIADGGTYEFTVVFVFSDLITPFTQGGTTMYNASFPAYPSLQQTASEANLTIIFPTGLNHTSSSYENEGINLTSTTMDNKQYFNYVKSNLTEFSEQEAWFTVSKVSSTLQILEAKEVKRTIEFSGLEQMTVTDSYIAVSKAEKLSSINLRLPKEASDISGFDELGSIPTDNVKVTDKITYTNVNMTFTLTYDAGKEALFAVHYQLPWKNYASTQGLNNFNVSVNLFENFDWTIRKLTTTIILPEGATFASQPLTPASLDSVQNDVFTSSMTFVFQNATPFQSLSFNFQYDRAIFWETFRPTMWISAVVIVAAAIAIVWSSARPTAAPVPTAIVRIRAEELKRFVDLYDEKRHFQRELETLEGQARKGKIPRRNYKVRKMTIESRLTSLSRDLKALEEKIRTAGPRYNDLMRQIEVAETELESIEADINRTEVRYRRGETSPAAYHKLLEDSYRRRERAKTTIDGVLLRLREETI